MASYLTASKVITKQAIGRSLVAENKEKNDESVDYIKKLFKQLTQLLTDTENTNKKISLESTLSDLNQFCCRLVDQMDYDCADFYPLNVFIIILKHYVKIFDMDQFVNAVTSHHSTVNNNFLRSLIDISHQFDIEKLQVKITIEDRREIFFSLFDLLHISTRMASFLENKFSGTSNDDNTSQTCITFCGSVLHAVIEIVQFLDVKVTGDDLKKYQTTLFNSFITFIDEYFIKKENLRVNKKQCDMLVQQMLDFIWNITDQTLTIPIFINASCPQACLRWLLLPYLNGDEYKSIINILDNIARHDEGAIILNKYECAKIVHQFQSKILNMRIDFMIDEEIHLHIRLISNLILVLVTDSDELLFDPIYSGILSHLLSTIKMDSKSKTRFTSNGLHISEPLIAIMKLSVNDNIIHYILQQDQFPKIFFTILKNILYYTENQTNDDDDDFDLHVLAIMALANIIWSISFHDQYRNHLIQNIELINQLDTFRTNDSIDKMLVYNFIPYRMFNLTKVFDGIWQNVYPSKPEIHISTDLTNNSPVRLLMISYSHVDVDFGQHLYHTLNKDPLLSISFDVNNNKFLWKEIAQTIERSDLLLFLISKDFFYSNSCRQELFYAIDTLKKSFIAVFIDADYQATGWLNDRLTDSKHIRFGRTDFIYTCNELLSMIHKSLSPINISSSSKTTTVVKKWNDKEVQQWFINNNIICELFEFYQFQNGNELLLFAESILAFAWTKEYERIRLRFEEKFKHKKESLSPYEFLKFNNALQCLKNKTSSLS